MPPGDVILVSAPSVVKMFPSWWIPSQEALDGIRPGHTEVKLRAIPVAEDGSADLWDGRPVWLRITSRRDGDMSGVIVSSALAHPDYEEGDVLTFATDRIFDLVHVSDTGTPFLNTDRAEAIIGKTVLVGMTMMSTTDELLDKREFVGKVVEVNPSSFVKLELTDEEEYLLPPDVRAFEEAREGEYRLRSTGEVVTNPDYVCTWTLRSGRGSVGLPDGGFHP